MSNHTINPSDHDEIIALLPWFVNQTLEEQQSRTISSHIECCADCQSEIQFLATLNESIENDVHNSHSVQADVDTSLASVMDRIDASNQHTNPVLSALSQLQQKLGEIFQFSSALPFPQWSASALAGLLVAVLGFQLYSDKVDNDYSVLSSSDVAHPSVRLSVEMAPTGNLEQIESIILLEVEKLGQAFVVERNANGAHIIVFNDAVDISDLSKLVTTLENEANIERVGVLP